MQAVLLSLLPVELLDLASAAATSEDASASGWLPKLLRWFHSTFTQVNEQQLRQLLQPQQQQHHQQPAGSSAASWQAGALGLLAQRSASVQQQLLACARARCGCEQQLALLLTALLRGVGFVSRSVW